MGTMLIELLLNEEEKYEPELSECLLIEHRFQIYHEKIASHPSDGWMHFGPIIVIFPCLIL